MCSTTWLGDHFPGARGVVQVAADLSAAATRSRTAARLAASTSFKSAMGPPVRESVIDLNEPANAGVQRRVSQLHCRATPHAKNPAPRKHFQLPSGIFLATMSTMPRPFTGAPPGDVINEPVNGRHSTAQPSSRKIISLYSGT